MKCNVLSISVVSLLASSLLLVGCNSKKNNDHSSTANNNISSYEDTTHDSENVDWGIGSKDIDTIGGYDYKDVKDAQKRNQEKLAREEEERKQREEEEQKRKEEASSKPKDNANHKHNWSTVHSSSTTTYYCNGKSFNDYYSAQDESIASGRSVSEKTVYHTSYICWDCGATYEE